MNEQNIFNYLSEVLDPDVGLPITELGMVGKIEIADSHILINIKLTSPLCPLSGEIEKEIENVLISKKINIKAKIAISIMNKEELEIFAKVIKKKSQENAEQYKNYLLDKPVYGFVSGKGGVGKSSTAALVAQYIAEKYNINVGVIDADIYGHSLDRIFGLKVEELKPIIIDNFIMPHLIKSTNIRFISIANFLQKNAPVILRGPMLHKILFRLIIQTYWKNIDLMIVDYPPGTGDIPLSMGRFLPNLEAFLITTAEPTSQRVAERMIMASKAFQLKIIGIVENMSYKLCTNCNHKDHLFGTNENNDIIAKKYNLKPKIEIPFLSSVMTGNFCQVNSKEKPFLEKSISQIVELMKI